MVTGETSAPQAQYAFWTQFSALGFAQVPEYVQFHGKPMTTALEPGLEKLKTRAQSRFGGFFQKNPRPHKYFNPRARLRLTSLAKTCLEPGMA
jgi:hypothetical protein